MCLAITLSIQLVELVELAQRRQCALPQLFDINPNPVQDASGYALPLASQTQEDVLGTHTTMAQAANLVHSERQCSAGAWHQFQFLTDWRFATCNVAF